MKSELHCLMATTTMSLPRAFRAASAGSVMRKRPTWRGGVVWCVPLPRNTQTEEALSICTRACVLGSEFGGSVLQRPILSIVLSVESDSATVRDQQHWLDYSQLLVMVSWDAFLEANKLCLVCLFRWWTRPISVVWMIPICVQLDCNEHCMCFFRGKKMNIPCWLISPKKCKYSNFFLCGGVINSNPHLKQRHNPPHARTKKKGDIQLARSWLAQLVILHFWNLAFFLLLGKCYV